MMNAQINNDLVWDLGGFSYPEAAVSFLKRFEQSFCVFSKSVQQIYSNYELMRTGPQSKTVVALPNPYAHHDIFFNILEEAVLPTGMVIMPGEVSGASEWVLCYRGALKSNKWRGMPLVDGLEKFKYKYGEDDPLLPILINTDLRRSGQAQKPLMHLHRVSLKKLKNLSDLELGDIQGTQRSVFVEL